jgi:hypothetical protein
MREMRKREKKLLRKYVTAAWSKAFWKGWGKGVVDGAVKERETIARALLEKTSLSEREVAEIVGMSTFSVQCIKNYLRGGQQ